MTEKNILPAAGTPEFRLRKAAAQNIHLLGGSIQDMMLAAGLTQTAALNFAAAIESVESAAREHLHSAGALDAAEEEEIQQNSQILDALIEANAHTIQRERSLQSDRVFEEIILAMPSTGLSAVQAARALGVETEPMETVYRLKRRLKHSNPALDRMESSRDRYEYADALHPSQETSLYLSHSLEIRFHPEPAM